jgi:septum site-determining protein MinC
MPTMSQTEPLDQDPVFQLKGSMLAITVLELARNDLENLDRQLAAKVAQAPNFFSNAPLVLALDKLPAGEGAVDLPGLMRVCRQHGLRTLAIRPAPVSVRWTRSKAKSRKNRKNRRSRRSSQRKSSPRPYAVGSRFMPRAAIWW